MLIKQHPNRKWLLLYGILAYLTDKPGALIHRTGSRESYITEKNPQGWCTCDDGYFPEKSSYNYDKVRYRLAPACWKLLRHSIHLQLKHRWNKIIAIIKE